LSAHSLQVGVTFLRHRVDQSGRPCAGMSHLLVTNPPLVRFSGAGGLLLSDTTTLPSPAVAAISHTHRSVATLEATAAKEATETQSVLIATKEWCKQSGVRMVAQAAGVDPGHLTKMLTGRRQPSRGLVIKLQATLIEPEDIHIE
jgi:hypothetical protein